MANITPSPAISRVPFPGLQEDGPVEFIPQEQGDGLTVAERAMNGTAIHNPAIYDRVMDLESDARAAAAVHNGTYEELMRGQESLSDARRELAILQHQEATGMPVSAARKAQTEASVARRQRELDEARDRHKAAAAIKAVTREHAEAALEYISANPDLKSVPDPAIKSDDPRSVVDKAKADQAAVEADKTRVRGLRRPKAEVLAKAELQIDGYAADVSWRVDEEGVVRPPLVALEATGNTAIRAIPDAFRLLMRDPAYRGKVKAEVRSIIERSYSGVTETATQEEKKSRITAINAKILDLQRLEVAAVRAMRARGDVAHFRRGLDIRAILGVDGPPPSKRR